MHIIGNPIIFIGVALPLCLVPVTVFGIHTTLAALLVIPALLMWIAFDLALGLGIAVAAVPLLWIAGSIAEKLPVGWVWIIAVSLFVLGRVMQIVGHQAFEGKRPIASPFPKPVRGDAYFSIDCSTSGCNSVSLITPLSQVESSRSICPELFSSMEMMPRLTEAPALVHS